MKRLFRILAVATVLSTCSFYAGAVDFGIRGGLVVSKLPQKNSDVKFFDNTIGFVAGASANVDLPLGFSIEPSLQYHLKGTNLNVLSESEAFKFGYIELPVMVQWGVGLLQDKLRVFAQAGPYLGYAVSKNQDLPWDDLNRFEVGAAVGAGARISSFQLSVLYDWSLGRLAKDAKISDFTKNFTKENFAGWTISLTYWF